MTPQHGCHGWASWAGPCGATDCPDCHPGHAYSDRCDCEACDRHRGLEEQAGEYRDELRRERKEEGR